MRANAVVPPGSTFVQSQEYLGSRGKIVTVVIMVVVTLEVVLREWDDCSGENFRPGVGVRLGLGVGQYYLEPVTFQIIPQRKPLSLPI